MTIRGSGNVSSISRTDTSRFTVNFTNNMPSTNYSVHVSVSEPTTSGGVTVGGAITGTLTNSSVGVRTSSIVNPSEMFVVIFA